MSRVRIHVDEPLLVLRRQRDLVVGPLAGQVDAEASHDRWRMPNDGNNLDLDNSTRRLKQLSVE